MPAEVEDNFMDTTDHDSERGADAQDTGRRDFVAGRSRGQTQNLGGTADAPPSNTASENSTEHFQLLRTGIDSLYLSYPGTLHESSAIALQELKLVAQLRNHESALAQYHVPGHCFEVKDRGARLFPWVLADDAFQIQFSSLNAKSLPMAYVKLSSRFLTHRRPSDAEAHLREVLTNFGDVQAPTVSRVDLFVDFACHLDMESFGRRAWVTRARQIAQYVQGADFTGWMIGAGGPVVARLYQKQIELANSKKFYLEDLWREAGWDGTTPVWRLEFQLEREILAQLGLSGLPSVLANRNGLWQYATKDWLRLTLPSETDTRRSRWSTHPLWDALADIPWEGDESPLLRQYSPRRAPSMEWLGRRVLSTLTSVAAVEGIAEFESVLNVAGNAAFQAMADQAHRIGIPEEQYFREKIACLNRLYNTAYNGGSKSDQDEQANAAEREYRKQSGG